MQGLVHAIRGKAERRGRQHGLAPDPQPSLLAATSVNLTRDYPRQRAGIPLHAGQVFRHSRIGEKCVDETVVNDVGQGELLSKKPPARRTRNMRGGSGRIAAKPTLLSPSNPSFPLDRAGWLRGYVVADAVDAADRSEE